MSGSTIGSFAGAAIGFMWGGPAGAQWGFMIGSAVGGYVDPQKIEGPRLTDAQMQTSNEGVPRPIVYGTAAAGGNIIQRGPLVEHKKSERAGKGGPVQTTYTYTRTVAIRICEAAPLGGEMKLRRVWMDDKLVYDVSGSGLLDADSAKFASILTFYSGAEDQLPDPSLEALPEANGGGVANVPSYRGTCYAVLTDLDCTDRQGAVPQFRWEVASDAVETPAPISYAATDYSRFIDKTQPLANPDTDYSLEATWTDAIGSGHFASAATIQDLLDLVGTSAGYGVPPTLCVGFIPDTTGPFSSFAIPMQGHGTDEDVTDLKTAWLCYQYHQPTVYHDDVWWNQNVNRYAHYAGVDGVWRCDSRGTLFTYTGPASATVLQPVAIEAIAQRVAPDASRLQEGEIALPDTSDFVLTPTGDLRSLGGIYTPVSGSYLSLSREATSGAFWVPRELGPVLPVSSPDNIESLWDAAYDAAVAAGELPAGYTYNSAGTGGAGTYPRTITNVYRLDDAMPATLTPGTVALSAIVSDLCERGDIGADQVDLSALAAIAVRGYPLARQTSASEAIQPLRDVFDFDLPEWGNSGDSTTKLRAVLRGGAIKVTITDEDLIDTDEDDDGTRPQQVEFPRKVSLTFADPDANYEPATQPAERTTENIKAVGETQISTNVVLSRDEAAVVADKLLKRLWEEANGRITRELPEEFSQYTPSDPVSYLGKRWRIEKVERAEGTNRMEMVRDRASAASSTATGSPAPTPTPPVSTIRGPTISAFMNLPSLRSADNVPGMYVAAQGLLPGWAGADIYLSVDGGVTEQKVMTILNPAVLGELATDCDADGADSSGLLEVQVLAGGELDSITEAQMDSRLNGFALITDGVAEVGQFQTATETSTEGLYDLTNVLRGQLGTTAAAHLAGDRFVLLDGNVRFLPLDAALGGQTLIFRAVSIGTAPANNPTTSVVFDPPAFVIDGGEIT